MRSLLLTLLATVLGCGLPPFEDPGDIVLPDDDDSSLPGDGDDDDDASDDDDDDDDATNPDDTDRSGVVWLLDRHLWTLPDEGLYATDAGASFQAAPPSTMLDLLGPAGLPLPGGLLHPDLDPFAGGEGCQVISHLDPRGPLPPSDDVGVGVHLVDEEGTSDVEIPFVEGGYRVEIDGAVTAEQFALSLEGGADWPGSDTPAALTMPDRPSGIVPTPGTISGTGLGSFHVQWVPDDPDVEGGRIEIFVLRFAAPASEGEWEGLRCLADDDGTYTMNASDLISAGSGDLQLSISRASWRSIAADASTGRPHLMVGAIRSVWYRATVGG
jgi:hypothetical protein